MHIFCDESLTSFLRFGFLARIYLSGDHVDKTSASASNWPDFDVLGLWVHLLVPLFCDTVGPLDGRRFSDLNRDHHDSMASYLMYSALNLHNVSIGSVFLRNSTS